MSIDELVAVNSLLIERETCLADLSHIEATISDILGEAYPFPDPPVALPSTQKGKRAKPAKKAKSKQPSKVRRLKTGEFAYRITLLENGQSKTHDILDMAPFQDLLAHPLPHHRIMEILTIDENLKPVESLFDSV